MIKPIIVIHGGAGVTINKTDEGALHEMRQVLKQSLKEGQAILLKQGKSQEAVLAAVTVMEDSPLFNAGKGSVFTHNGKNEMDATMMCGKTLKAGGVGAVKAIKNPIKAAELVMEKSPHCLLVGEGAEQFAKENDLEIVDPSYFYTEHRYEQLQKAIKEERIVLDHDGGKQTKGTGTVGAVALDVHGNLCAATSTGGLTNKRFGRIGDSAVVGAGTYANNETLAMSATGTGDIFMLVSAGNELSALYRYKGLSLTEGVDAVLDKVKALGGYGGIIAIDCKGNYAMQMNTPGMYRGVAKGEDEPSIYVFADEEQETNEA